jgi:ankyrin repeat protein
MNILIINRFVNFFSQRLIIAKCLIGIVLLLFLIRCAAAAPVLTGDNLEKANATLTGLFMKRSLIGLMPDKKTAASVTVENLQAVLDGGANVTAEDPTRHMTVLMLAAYGGNLKCVQLLVASGADVNAHTSIGTPLMEAAASGDLACVKYLVSKGANIHYTDAVGATAFTTSIASGNLECVKYFMANGCGVKDKTTIGVPVLITAVVGISIAHKMDCVKYLVDKGADVNAVSFDGSTPLLTAVAYNNAACVKYLISKGAKVNVKDKNSCTPLKLAQMNRASDIIKILKAAGAK